MVARWWPVVAVAAVALGAALSSRDCVARLHALLAYSAKLPMPTGAPVDVAVVLGYALHRDGSMTAPLMSRVEVATQLFTQGNVSRLLFSGAQPDDRPRDDTEANIMLEYAQQVTGLDPAPTTWRKEERSTSTRLNAVYSLDIIRDHGWQSLVIVTNPFHQYRSALVFAKAVEELYGPRGDAIKVYVAQAPFMGHEGWGPPMVNRAVDYVDFVRELAALAWYKYKGYF